MDLRTKTPKKYSFIPSLLFIGTSIACIVIGASCKDQATQNFKSDIVFPDSLVSFSKQIEPLFQQTCVASGCHGGLQPAANLDLTYGVCWRALIDYSPPIVIVKNGNKSPLVMYLDGRLAPQMPLRSTPLTANQINGVKKWIDEGAKPN